MSDFLRKLKESVDSGKPNESIKAGFGEILNRAEKIAADPKALEAIKEKIEKINEQEGLTLQKQLTAEEVAALNKLAKEQEEKMFENEQKNFVASGVVAFNCEIEVINDEIANRLKLIEKYKGHILTLQGTASYEEKVKLINDSLAEFNKRGKSGA